MSTAYPGQQYQAPMPGQNPAPQGQPYPGQAAPAPQPQYQAPQQQYPGQAPQPQYQAPMPGQYQQPQGQAPAPQGQRAPSTVVEVIRSNYTTIALFEVSGGFDPGQKFPKSLCFVLGVPGVKDPSKQSGRSYNQSAKINMKFSTQEIRSLGRALINLSMFKQGAAPFEKHSDPSKNSYTQGQGEQTTKKLVAKFDPNKNNITITMNFGQLNVLIPVPLQDALGLGEDLINIGNVADLKLAEFKMSNKIGREEVEMPEHINLDEPQQPGAGQPQYAQPQYQAPVGQQYAPAPQPQYQGAPAPVGAPQYAPAPQQVAQPQYQAPVGQPQYMPGQQG